MDQKETAAPRPRNTLRRLLCLALAGLLPASAAADLVYRNVFKLDAEYELDRFMTDVPWEWRDRFASAPTGFLASGCSLNIRHIALDQRLKVRFPLSERWAFRFRHDRRLGLERQDVETQLEFEHGPHRRLFFSLIGEPTFHKSDVLAGLAVRWGEMEGRSVKFAYLWPGFDANYAFSNQSVNEGFEEFYRRAPQEARLTGTWLGQRASIIVEGRHRRRSQLAQRVFSSPATQTILEEGSSEARADLRWRWWEWTAALEAEGWKGEQRDATDPASAAEMDVVHERSSVRFSLEKSLGSSWRARAGGGEARLRGRQRFSAAPPADQFYRLHDRPWFFLVRRAFDQRFSMDGGFIYDRQGIASLEAGQTPVAEKRSQNRGKLAMQYDFPNGSFFRLAAALELDTNQEETFASFDGATVQFQTTFQ